MTTVTEPPETDVGTVVGGKRTEGTRRVETTGRGGVESESCLLELRMKCLFCL